MSINREEFQKRQATYSDISTEDRLTTILSEELAKSIDAEVIKRVMSLSNDHEGNVDKIIKNINEKRN